MGRMGVEDRRVKRRARNLICAAAGEGCDLVDFEITDADARGKAILEEAMHRRPCLVQRHITRSMQKIEIESFDAEAAQRCFAGAAHIVTSTVRVPELSNDGQLVSRKAVQRFA